MVSEMDERYSVTSLTSRGVKLMRYSSMLFAEIVPTVKSSGRSDAEKDWMPASFGFGR